MPYLNLKTSVPPSAELAGKLARVLTELTVEVLGKKRELTSVAIEFVPGGQWFIGGAPMDGGNAHTFLLDIKVTEGTNTKGEKADYVAQAYRAAEALLGGLHPASYVLIHEVRGDAWGYQGATQEFRYIKGKSL